MEDLTSIITIINSMPFIIKLFCFDAIVFFLFEVSYIYFRKKDSIIYYFFLYLRAGATIITNLYLLFPFWKIVMTILCIVGLYYLIRYIYRMKMSKKEMLYYRDIPKNYSVIEVITFMDKYYLFSKKKLIQSVLLDLKAKNKILIQENTDEIHFSSMIQIAPFDDKLEQYVYNFLIDKNKYKYSMEELFYMAKEQLVQKGILRKKKAIEQISEIFLSYIVFAVLTIIGFLVAVHMEQYILKFLLSFLFMVILWFYSVIKVNKSSNRTVWQQIGGVLCDFFVFFLLMGNVFFMSELVEGYIIIMFLALWFPFMIKCIRFHLEHYEYTPTKKGKKFAIKLKALKRFFQDFSTLDEKSAEDIIFWERYLSFAYALDVNTNYGDLGNKMQLMRADERKHYFGQKAYLIGEFINFNFSAKEYKRDLKEIKKMINSRKEETEE